MSSIRWSVPPHVRLEETGDAILILDATRGGVHRLVGPSAVVIRAAMSPDGAAGLTGEELAAAEALEVEGLLVRSGGREISRRTALTAGAAAALGITTLMLPAAAVAASVEPLEADHEEMIGSDTYNFWVFTSLGTTTFVADGVPSGSDVDVLVVGGGGGGAGGALVTHINSSDDPPTTTTRHGLGGGGGGGGGFVEKTLALSGGVPVTVGSGGTGGSAGADDGSPAVEDGSGSVTLKVYLGQDGAAGTASAFGSDTAGGGSGGKAAGGEVDFDGFTAVWGPGAAPGGVGGDPSGGRGGDGGGSHGAAGGEPEDWFDQDGSSVDGVSGGGGGGGGPDLGQVGGDGVDGGGDGADKKGDASGGDAATNRGGGGGGGTGSGWASGGINYNATAGGRGGNGIVIVRYPSIP